MCSDVASLAGLKVLVLEDEPLVSMMLEDMLLDFGCEVVGPFASVGQALALVSDGREGRVDIAILDVNVAGEHSFSVAQALIDRGTPFIFSSGLDDFRMDPRWAGRPNLQKPFASANLEKALVEAWAAASASA